MSASAITTLAAGLFAGSVLGASIAGSTADTAVERSVPAAPAVVEHRSAGLSAPIVEAFPPVAESPPPVEERRVLAIGDSLLHDTLPALHQRLAELDITHRIEAVPGSGLLSHHAPVDWQRRAEELVRSFRPTDVVVEFCCNYWPPYLEDAAGLVEPGTEAFERHWAEAAAELRRSLSAGGATLHWVLTPPTGHGELNRTLVDPINRTTLAAAAADPAVALVDWIDPLTAGTGTYSQEIDGEPVRTHDRVHLAPAGGELAADAVVAALRVAD